MLVVQLNDDLLKKMMILNINTLLHTIAEIILILLLTSLATFYAS